MTAAVTGDHVIDYLAHAFPVQRMAPFTDENGNLMSRPMVDRDGHPVLSREALAARDALIEQLAALPPVPSALDQVVHHFGHESVAEVTGRSRRVVKLADANGERLAVRSRPASSSLAKTAAFMAGEKRLLVFSMAGGTGRSYHADLGCGNTARRVHYLLEPGWRPFPALVAAVSGPDGTLEGVQRTWLHPKRPAKAPVAQPRKALGRVHGHAVRFGAPGCDGTTLLVGEGIETVLSLVAAVPALPAAAALSAGSLAALVPPPGTARLLIAADRDAAGRRVAAGLEARAMAQGIAAVVLVPAHGDFNDDLAALGPWALAAARRPAPRPRGVSGAALRAQRDAASAILGPCASSTPQDRYARTTTTPSRPWTGWTWMNSSP